MIRTTIRIATIGGLVYFGTAVGIGEDKKNKPKKGSLEKQLCTAIKHEGSKNIPSFLLLGANVKPKKN